MNESSVVHRVLNFKRAIYFLSKSRNVNDVLFVVAAFAQYLDLKEEVDFLEECEKKINEIIAIEK